MAIQTLTERLAVASGGAVTGALPELRELLHAKVAFELAAGEFSSVDGETLILAEAYEDALEAVAKATAAGPEPAGTIQLRLGDNDLGFASVLPVFVPPSFVSDPGWALTLTLHDGTTIECRAAGWTRSLDGIEQLRYVPVDDDGESIGPAVAVEVERILAITVH